MEAFISQFGYIAVAALIFLENIFPPIPSEVILPFSGFLTNSTQMTLPGVIIASTVGALLGAYLLYGIGRVISRERLINFFNTKTMRLLGFKGEEVGRVVDWFDTKGQITVLLCRCIPGVRSLISIPAGTAQMKLGRFTLLTVVGSGVWNTILCTMGSFAGSAWEQVSNEIGWLSDIVKYVLIAAFIALCVWWIIFRAYPVWKEGKDK